MRSLNRNASRSFNQFDDSKVRKKREISNVLVVVEESKAFAQRARNVSGKNYL